jgi:hypothetical protein
MNVRRRLPLRCLAIGLTAIVAVAVTLPSAALRAGAEAVPNLQIPQAPARMFSYDEFANAGHPGAPVYDFHVDLSGGCTLMGQADGTGGVGQLKSSVSSTRPGKNLWNVDFYFVDDSYALWSSTSLSIPFDGNAPPTAWNAALHVPSESTKLLMVSSCAFGV